MGWGLAVLVPVALLTVFFGWPVGAMLWRGLSTEGRVDLGPLIEVLTTERTWRIIAQTLGMALAGTVGSVLLGVPGAFALYRLRFPGRLALRALVAIPFVLPTVVVGVAFRALLAKQGPLGFLGLDGTITAVVLAMVFFNYSVVVRTVGLMWSSLDVRAVDAARTLGASSWRAFRTVTLPQLMPAIASAASIVFLFCSTAFGIVQTLGRPGVGTIETEIYVQTTLVHLDTAAVLSCIQFFIVIAVVLVSNRLRRSTETSLRMRDTRPRAPQRPDLAALVVTVAIAIVLVAAPLVALVARSFSTREGWGTRNYELLATSSGAGFGGGTTVLEALDHSVRIAIDATWIALLIAVPLALVLSRRPKSASWMRGQRLLDGAIMLPLGVSAVTVGFGFVVSIQAVVPDLARTGLLVPIAQAVVAVPMVVRVLVPTLRAIDPRQREVAATLGADPGRILRTIDGPVLVRGLGLGAGFAFAMSLGEFGATSFLASPEFITLPVLIARLLGRPGADNYGIAMAGAVILALLTAGVMLIAEQLRPRDAKEGPLW